MKPIQQSMGATEWLLLTTLSALWGGSFFFVDVAVDALPPFTIVALRVGMAALALNLVVGRAVFSESASAGMWGAFFGMGLLNNVIPFCLIVYGQTQIAGGLASILNAATPFSTIAVAHFFTQDEKFTPERLIGLTVAFSGVVTIVGAEAINGLSVNLLAQLAVLAATVSYGFAGVFGRRFQRAGIHPVVAAAGQLTGSTLMLIPLSLLVDKPWSLQMPELEIIAAVLCLALFSTALAYIIYFRILAASGASNLLLVTLLIPATAIFLGATFLGEQLVIRQFAGLSLLVCGLVVVDGRLYRSLKNLR